MHSISSVGKTALGRFFIILIILTFNSSPSQSQSVGIVSGYNPSFNNYWGTYSPSVSAGLFYYKKLNYTFGINVQAVYQSFTVLPQNGNQHKYEIGSLPLQASFSLYGSEPDKWQGKFLIGFSASHIFGFTRVVPDSAPITPVKYTSNFPVKITTQFGFELKRITGNRFITSIGTEYKHFHLPDDNLNLQQLSIYLKMGFDMRSKTKIVNEKKSYEAMKKYKEYLLNVSPPDLEL